MARQASAERTWQSIARFYNNCKKKKPGKKGYPRFKKNTRSVEYKTSGWKLSDDAECWRGKQPDRQTSFANQSHSQTGLRQVCSRCGGHATLTSIRLAPSNECEWNASADGYYAQFCVDVEREIKHEYTGSIVGIDLGLEYFYTASDGQTVANPRRLRKSEKRLKRLQRRVSKRKNGGKNRRKAINKMARQHLKVSRQRKDFAVKTSEFAV